MRGTDFPEPSLLLASAYDFSSSASGTEIIFVETTHADNLLGSLNNINPIPRHVDPASNLGQRMAIEAATLKSYNAGAFTPESPDDTCHDALR
jgi:hypothetical protein